MFKLQPKPTFTATVSFPTVEGPAEITFVFRHKGRKAIKAFFDEIGEKSQSDTGVNDAAIIAELVADWKGVDGEFNKENLELLLDNFPSATKAILDAYLPALIEGREKN